MHNLELANEYLAECLAELAAIQVPCGRVSDLVVNTTAKTRWGRCHKFPDGTFQIEISHRLLADDVDPIAAKTTLIHELLHTCSKCMNHGAQWQKWAAIVNQHYGYNVKRTTSSEEKGVEDSPAKYLIICNKCGATVAGYHRASSRVRNPEKYRHNGCGGTLRVESKDGEAAVIKAQAMDAPYRYVCTQCGARIEHYRACKFTRNYQKCRCGKCGGKFKRF